MGEPDDLVDSFEAGRILGVKPETVRTYRHHGLLREDTYLGRTPVWKRATVIAFKESRRSPGRPPRPDPDEK